MGILPPSETTFPEVLQRNGYRTGAFGKVHLTPEQYTLNQLQSDEPILDWRRFAADGLLQPVPDDPWKANYGFTDHVGVEDILPGRFRHWLRQRAPDLVGSKPIRPCPDAPGQLRISPYPSELHPSTFIADSAADFIKSQKSDQPWLAFCSFVAPHHPFEAPADQIARYDLDSVPLPEFKGGVDSAFIPPPAADAIGEMRHFPESIQRRIVQHYLASISLIDDNVGRLIESLDASGQREDTLIIFNSDHGEFLGNHDLLRKPSLHYDETLRVPLVIALPGDQTPARRDAGLVELTDVFPTLLGLLGIAVTPGVQGIDWSSALCSGDPIGRPDIYSDMFDVTPQRFGELAGPYIAVQTIRTDQWKLNIYPTASQQFGQLFNLTEDPDESRNLYHDSHYRNIREELLWQLLARNHLNTDPLPPYLTQY